MLHSVTSTQEITQSATQKATQNVTQQKPLSINRESSVYEMLKGIFNTKSNTESNTKNSLCCNKVKMSNKTTPAKPKIPSALNGLARKNFEAFFRETYQSATQTSTQHKPLSTNTNSIKNTYRQELCKGFYFVTR